MIVLFGGSDEELAEWGEKVVKRRLEQGGQQPPRHTQRCSAMAASSKGCTAMAEQGLYHFNSRGHAAKGWGHEYLHIGKGRGVQPSSSHQVEGHHGKGRGGETPPSYWVWHPAWSYYKSTLSAHTSRLRRGNLIFAVAESNFGDAFAHSPTQPNCLSKN